MSKPIFIIRIPGTWGPDQIDYSRSAIYNNKELCNDYHVMVLADREIESTTFEMYNAPNDPDKLENITKLIELSIERCLRQEEEQRKKEENE